MAKDTQGDIKGMSRRLLFDVDGTLATIVAPMVTVLNELAPIFRYAPIHDHDILRTWDWEELPKKLGIHRFRWRQFLRRQHELLSLRCEPVSIQAGMVEVLQIVSAAMGSVLTLTATSVNRLAESPISSYIEPAAPAKQTADKTRALQDFLKNNHLTRHEIIFIADEVSDIQAAKKLFIPTIAVTWGANNETILRAARPDAVITTPMELLTVISRGE